MGHTLHSASNKPLYIIISDLLPLCEADKKCAPDSWSSYGDIISISFVIKSKNKYLFITRLCHYMHLRVIYS